MSCEPSVILPIMWFRLTSTRCKGKVKCEATTHFGHFNILPLGQSLHLIIPGAFRQLEHLVWPRKSPSPLCQRSSSKNVLLNLSHSLSCSWWWVRIWEARNSIGIMYHIFCVSLPLGFHRLLLRWRFNVDRLVPLLHRLSFGGDYGWWRLILSGREHSGLGCNADTSLVWLADCDKKRQIWTWRGRSLRVWGGTLSDTKSSRFARAFRWRYQIGRIWMFSHGFEYFTLRNVARMNEIIVRKNEMHLGNVTWLVQKESILGTL